MNLNKNSLPVQLFFHHGNVGSGQDRDDHGWPNSINSGNSSRHGWPELLLQTHRKENNLKGAIAFRDPFLAYLAKNGRFRKNMFTMSKKPMDEIMATTIELKHLSRREK